MFTDLEDGIGELFGDAQSLCASEEERILNDSDDDSYRRITTGMSVDWHKQWSDLGDAQRDAHRDASRLWWRRHRMKTEPRPMTQTSREEYERYRREYKRRWARKNYAENSITILDAARDRYAAKKQGVAA